MNSLDKMEDYDRLAKLYEEKDAQIAMQAETLTEVKTLLAASMHETRPYKEYVGAIAEINSTLSATSETVAAWRAKETKPLRREVAMQAKCIELFFDCFDILNDGPDESDEALALGYLQEARELRTKLKADTQATALAYEREVENRGAVKALEAESRLRGMAAELRAQAGAK